MCCCDSFLLCRQCSLRPCSSVSFPLSLACCPYLSLFLSLSFSRIQKYTHNYKHPHQKMITNIHSQIIHCYSLDQIKKRGKTQNIRHNKRGKERGPILLAMKAEHHTELVEYWTKISSRIRARTHTHAHTHSTTHAHTYICMHTHKHTQTNTRASCISLSSYKNTLNYTCTSSRSRTRARTHTHTHAHTLRVHNNIHTHASDNTLKDLMACSQQKKKGGCVVF